MTSTTSTAYSRDLGDQLRRLRETAARLNGHAMAVHLGWDPSKVSNVEHGKVRASDLDLVQYLTACGQDIDFFEAFRDSYRHAFDPYVVQEPENLRTLGMVEVSAKKITAYDVVEIPDLLQTVTYARAVLQEKTDQPELAASRRMDRQSVIRRPHSPECVFYVHELALQLPVGDARVMKDQYLRLVFNAHMVRIVPANAKHTALQSSRALFEFEKQPPVAYCATDLAQVFSQDEKAVERCNELFARLDTIAMNEEQTRARLMEYASGPRAA